MKFDMATLIVGRKMSSSVLELRPGRHLNQIFSPIHLEETPSGILYGVTARLSVLIHGLMRQAKVKANGDEVVASLNRAHALGWASGHWESTTRDALRDLFVEMFVVSTSAAEIGATLVCDRLNVSGSQKISENPDQFLHFARDYLNNPAAIPSDLMTGVLLDANVS